MNELNSTAMSSRKFAVGIGLFLLLFLATLILTPLIYFVPVGGQPVIPGPPSFVVVFELTMLGMLISTFVGVFLDSRFPSYRPMEYVPEVSDGKITAWRDYFDTVPFAR